MVLFHDYSLPLDVQETERERHEDTLMTLSILKGTLLMLEEPECHQHQVRWSVCCCTMQAGQSLEVQIIVSTHSAVRAVILEGSEDSQLRRRGLSSRS